MNAMTPQTVLLLASTTGVGFLMVVAGLEKRALEWRRRRRICPGCGRRIPGRICNCSH
jgi:NADH pyrophosphatase NudC (nudix superfamily)